MSVCIKDMEMPNSCSFCVFRMYINNLEIGCEWHPSEPPVEIGDERPNYCPLVEV